MKFHIMEYSLSKQVGKRIRELIHHNGYTMEQFAKMSGVGRPNLYRICKGSVKNLNLMHIQLIALALSVKISTLIDTETDIRPPLTGHNAVDNMLYSYTSLLYAGVAGLEKIKRYVTEDYRLQYLHTYDTNSGALSDPNSIDLKTEIMLNQKEKAKHSSMFSQPISAYLYGTNMVIQLLKTTIYEKKTIPNRLQILST